MLPLEPPVDEETAEVLPLEPREEAELLDEDAALLEELALEAASELEDEEEPVEEDEAVVAPEEAEEAVVDAEDAAAEPVVPELVADRPADFPEELLPFVEDAALAALLDEADVLLALELEAVLV